MNLKEIEKVVAGIQQQLFKNSNSYSAGILRSSVKGSGLQFKEHQVYSHGDDVRFIDWKLSARSTETYIKTFEEERNAEIISIIDMSPSMFYGYRGVSKIQCAFEIICLLYLLVKETNDKQSVLIVGGDHLNLPPKQGKEGIVLFVSMLEKLNLLTEDGKINIEYTCDETFHDRKLNVILKSHIAKGKEVIFFSDFTNFSNYTNLNKFLLYKNFHCFKLNSPIDEYDKFPFSLNSIQISNGERKKKLTRNMTEKREEDLTNKRWKDISVQDRYLEKFIKEMV